MDPTVTVEGRDYAHYLFERVSAIGDGMCRQAAVGHPARAAGRSARRHGTRLSLNGQSDATSPFGP